MLLSKMAEYHFRDLKTFLDKEDCVVNAVPRLTGYKNNGRPVFLRSGQKQDFRK